MTIRLTKVRLVNWHIFGDVSMSIGQMSLFAGDNGSGKSTIIDAIQYAMVADRTHVKFNSAASDRRTGRTLDSYCRGKIGAEELDYIRGDCVTHVILEFTDSENVFCAGIAIEAFRDGSIPSETPWIAENIKADTIPVSGEGRILTIKKFKEYIKDKNGSYFSSKKQYLEELTMKLGVHRRNAEFNPYLEALVRAVSFTPLASVDRFICDYILEDKPLDISEMKQNLENYRLAEKEARGVEERIRKLESLEHVLADIRSEEKKISYQTYLKTRLEWEIAVDECDRNTVSIEETRQQLKEILNGLEHIEGERIRAEQSLEDCHIALGKNDAHIIYESLSRQIEEGRRAAEDLSRRAERKKLLISQASALLGRPLGRADEEGPAIEREKNESIEKKLELSRQKMEDEASLARYAKELEDLKRGVFHYPEETEKLRAALKSRKIEAYVFADLLDVVDEEWQNAVEGWLNTQRFNILVGEDDFQRALEVYRSLPRSVSGVGIPDLEKMRAARPRAGSLFHVVRPLSPMAETYAAYVLGDVMMATLDTLRKHRKSVTKECMRYSSFTASRIREDIYERWYIGRAAKERRIAFLESEIKRLREAIGGLASGIEKAENRLNVLDRVLAALSEIRGYEGTEELLVQRLEEVKRLEEQRAKIDTSSFDSLKRRIEELRGILASLDVKLGEMNSAKGAAEERISALEKNHPALVQYRDEKKAAFDDFCVNITDLEEHRRYYDERIRQTTPAELLKNYSTAVKNAETRLRNLNAEFIKQTTQYNRDHSESLSGDPGPGDEVSVLLKKFQDTELPAYKDRINKAKQDAEQQFMGDFVSRLSENLANARESIRELNQTLKAITFGRNRYRFSLEEKLEKKREIGVIRKAAEISRNANTLFETLTAPEDKKVVDELFKTILEKDLSSPEVRSICDYRSYYQYDIKMYEMIDAPAGEESGMREIESSLSRVIREKSGGEAQTPYYVAIAASFLRFFRGGNSTVRLALFDEAFNKMDDSRIGTTIDFFKKIGIQVITAVPTEKIETIAPFMDLTNLVIRHGLAADVREYRIREMKPDGANG